MERLGVETTCPNHRALPGAHHQGPIEPTKRLACREHSAMQGSGLRLSLVGSGE